MFTSRRPVTGDGEYRLNNQYKGIAVCIGDRAKINITMPAFEMAEGWLVDYRFRYSPIAHSDGAVINTYIHEAGFKFKFPIYVQIRKP